MSEEYIPKYQRPEFLRLHAQGLTNRQIAERLGTTVGTAENWVRKAKAKGLLGARRTHKVWTPERVAEAKRLFDSHVNMVEMAETMGVTLSAMRACVAHRKWTRGNRNVVNIPVDVLHQLVSEGLSDVEIAKKLGCRSSTVQRRRTAAGIVAAVRGHAHQFTPAMETQLLRLFKAGFSSTSIAKQMKVSPGFVRKRAKALGIWDAMPIQRAKHLTKPETRKKAEATKREKRGLPIRVIPVVQIDEPTPEVIPDHARPWLTRKFGECAYPYGERGNVHSCCKPTFNGTSLCEGHAALCFDYRKAA